ncbi:MAG TPA: sialidase family protein [Candidatus Dormibacteraeota bacterium]|nr:sialidase family protein [Candidatus Dormibacteraeota bacterium]
MKASRIGIALVIAALTSLAFAISPSAGSFSPNQVPTWWQKGQWLLDNQAPLTCSTGVADSSQSPNIDISNELTPQSETSIAINPGNPSTILAGSNEIFCLPMAAFVSTAGGAQGTWKHSAPPLPPPLTTNGQDFGSDPGVAWDTKGNVFYAYIVVFFNRTFHAVQGSEMAVAHSTDGKTWSATFFNPNVGNGKFNDKPMITVDRNPSSPHKDRVYVAWDNASPKNGKSSDNDVVLESHSDDGGVTFSTPAQASPSQGGPAAVIGADPFVGPDGTLYVAWQDGINPSIQVAASTDGGDTFGGAVQIASTLGVFQVLPPAQALRGALIYPACGASGTRLVCSWSDATASDGMRVFVSHSDNGGASWSTAQRVSNPAGVSDQFNQWLAVDPVTGKVVLSWNDSRNDPTRKSTDIFFAKSADGGSTFSTMQVTNASTNETTAGADLGNQYGDYEGISAFNNAVQPVWTDRRASVAGVANLDEEVFTETISI